MSYRKFGAVVAAIMINAAVATSPAAAGIIFTNQTGKPVNDFHIVLTWTGGNLKAANSKPWGMSRITDGNTANWAGGAIANGGTLTVPRWNLGAPDEFGNITIKTPNLRGLGIAEAYWTFNNVKVGTGFPDDVTVTATVPEPGSWAMLIAGFGLVGATLRRRRTVLA
jgi:hypothetical protein